MVGTSRDRDISQYKQNHGWNFKRQGYITVQTESWLELQETRMYHSRNRIMVGTSRDRDISQYKQNHGWNQETCITNRIMVGTSREGYITVETESWLELQETGIYTVETESWLELQETGMIYHSTNRIMVGTLRDRDISQYKQNHGWNFKRQGYIRVQTESWWELQETGIYQSANRSTALKTKWR